jgi:hypothetical protein
MKAIVRQKEFLRLRQRDAPLRRERDEYLSRLINGANQQAVCPSRCNSATKYQSFAKLEHLAQRSRGRT